MLAGYHISGARANVPINKEVTVGFQLVNAWNTIWGNNNMDNIGLTLAVAKKKFSYFANYYEGPNHIGTTKGKRNLFDSTLIAQGLKPSSQGGGDDHFLASLQIGVNQPLPALRDVPAVEP